VVYLVLAYLSWRKDEHTVDFGRKACPTGEPRIGRRSLDLHLGHRMIRAGAS